MELNRVEEMKYKAFPAAVGGYLIARGKNYHAYILHSGESFEVLKVESVFALFFRVVEAFFAGKEITVLERSMIHKLEEDSSILQGASKIAATLLKKRNYTYGVDIENQANRFESYFKDLESFSFKDELMLVAMWAPYAHTQVSDPYVGYLLNMSENFKGYSQDLEWRIGEYERGHWPLKDCPDIVEGYLTLLAYRSVDSSGMDEVFSHVEFYLKTVGENQLSLRTIENALQSLEHLLNGANATAGRVAELKEWLEKDDMPQEIKDKFSNIKLDHLGDIMRERVTNFVLEASLAFQSGLESERKVLKVYESELEEAEKFEKALRPIREKLKNGQSADTIQINDVIVAGKNATEEELELALLFRKRDQLKGPSSSIDALKEGISLQQKAVQQARDNLDRWNREKEEAFKSMQAV